MAEVIVALDVPSGPAAFALIDRLAGLRWVKVGGTLFVAEGPDVIRACVERGLQVFLDLKWHDIPHQVTGAVRAAADLGVALASVHVLGGPRMLEAAQGAAGALQLVGVSVLTSHDDDELTAVLGRRARAQDEVRRLAGVAHAAGLAGLVASPAEATTVRTLLGPEAVIVTPGVRPDGGAAGDQRRFATPREAVTRGATHLVVGRPITHAADPNTVYRELCRDAG